MFIASYTSEEVNRVLGNIIEYNRMQLSPEIKVVRLLAREREREKALTALFAEH